jgi:hypothetical protein
MIKIKKKSKTELMKEACREQYDGLAEEPIKEEIARLNKINFATIEDKKATTKSFNELIKENSQKIEFLVEKLDAVRHDAAVAHQIGMD